MPLPRPLPSPLHPRRLYMLAIFVAFAAMFVAVGVANIKNKDMAGAVTMAVGITVTAAVYRVGWA